MCSFQAIARELIWRLPWCLSNWRGRDHILLKINARIFWAEYQKWSSQTENEPQRSASWSTWFLPWVVICAKNWGLKVPKIKVKAMSEEKVKSLLELLGLGSASVAAGQCQHTSQYAGHGEKTNKGPGPNTGLDYALSKAYCKHISKVLIQMRPICSHMCARTKSSTLST